MKESKPRGRISEYLRQNAIALVALFFALTGGVGWATHPGGANTIDSADIINAEVGTADLATAAVNAARLAPDSVVASKVVDETIRSADVLNNSLLSEDILDGTIDGIDIATNGVRGVDVDESTLGTVPRAEDANQASSAQ